MDQMDYGAVLPPSLMVFFFKEKEGEREAAWVETVKGRGRFYGS